MEALLKVSQVMRNKPVSDLINLAVFTSGEETESD